VESGFPTVVLVHGAWHGPWVWDEVRRQLDIADIPSTTVALPSVGDRTDRLGGLADDVAAICAELDRLTGPFVLVGHSYAGVPISEVAATRSDVGHCVYVSGFLLPPGQSLLDAVGGQPQQWWIIDENGSSLLPDDPRALFYNQTAPALADNALARLRPHSMRSVREPLREAAYGQQPATYVVCEQDHTIPPETQRAMAELAAAKTVCLDSDHSPMLSRPAELTVVLCGAAVRTAFPRPVNQ
jgi:pimeloyl-ACP methyl ester carboxylesterase